jgi:hypothetical protein
LEFAFLSLVSFRVHNSDILACKVFFCQSTNLASVICECGLDLRVWFGFTSVVSSVVWICECGLELRVWFRVCGLDLRVWFGCTSVVPSVVWIYECGFECGLRVRSTGCKTEPIEFGDDDADGSEFHPQWGSVVFRNPNAPCTDALT